MHLIIPRALLEWIDANRGELSRQSFMIKTLFKMKEAAEIGKN